MLLYTVKLYKLENCVLIGTPQKHHYNCIYAGQLWTFPQRKKINPLWKKTICNGNEIISEEFLGCSNLGPTFQVR